MKKIYCIMRLKLFLKPIIILLFFVLSSCSKNEEIVSKTLSVQAFSYIQIDDSFDIFLIEDTCFSVEIRAVEDIVDQINCTVSENKLIISNSTSAKWLSPTNNKIEIYIKSKPLEEVILNETCHLQTVNPISSVSFGLIMKSKTNWATLDLACETFYYWNDFPCGGKLSLQGKVKELKLWNTAILSIDAKNLVSQTALVENNSQGDCSINVSEKLTYSITNKGNIYVYGNPSQIIEKETSSSGQLIMK